MLDPPLQVTAFVSLLQWQKKKKIWHRFINLTFFWQLVSCIILFLNRLFVTFEFSSYWKKYYLFVNFFLLLSSFHLVQIGNSKLVGVPTGFGSSVHGHINYANEIYFIRGTNLISFQRRSRLSFEKLF